MKRLIVVCVLMSLVIALPEAQPQAEKLDLATIARIRDEGLKRSQVMDHISWLSDVYGPRLTGGPGIKQAADWTMKKFSGVGARERAPRDASRSARAGRSCASART